jgi:hypothetical protein
MVSAVAQPAYAPVREGPRPRQATALIRSAKSPQPPPPSGAKTQQGGNRASASFPSRYESSRSFPCSFGSQSSLGLCGTEHDASLRHFGRDGEFRRSWFIHVGASPDFSRKSLPGRPGLDYTSPVIGSNRASSPSAASIQASAPTGRPLRTNCRRHGRRATDAPHGAQMSNVRKVRKVRKVSAGGALGLM